LRAVFIRAPWVEEHGPDVQVLAELDEHPVAVRQGDVLAVAFHPEIAGDPRIHALFLDIVRQAANHPGVDPGVDDDRGSE
jgi:5'-phosphate synthase pdxT subunit